MVEAMSLETTVIPLSKTKLLALLIGCLLFFALGVFLLLNPEIGGRRYSSEFVWTAGLVGTLFFGILAPIIARKMLDRKPGLIIKDEGIIDNSSAVAIGLIPWSDIRGFAEVNVEHTRQLLIYVRTPERYLEGQNKLGKKLMNLCIQNYQTPISLTAAGLKITFDELRALCESSWAIKNGMGIKDSDAP